MGGAISKQIPTRKFTEKVATNVKSSASETRSQINNEREAETTARPLASMTRDRAIEVDGKDPHLLQNLSSIEQVMMPKTNIRYKQSNNMRVILNRRKAIKEQEESDDTQIGRNRLTIQDIHQLFENRKSAPQEWTIEILATHYNLEPSTVQTLLKHVNTVEGVWVDDLAKVKYQRKSNQRPDAAPIN
ncbi:12088_t:CDS:2 [Ambispora gerdemannii]|uniref:12088_t:CDS:1 n=1 Tax=Ambispora gerdemannii TaxID=144530 RepID=A0A9N8WM81_9GLOM|nr:12088_t:CDS:2 [Ambispora gerdemannii]